MTSVGRLVAIGATAALAVVVSLFATSADAADVRLRPGDVAPNAVGFDREAAPVSLDGYRGRVVVISFWASWCPPCMKELPILDGIQRSAGRDRLQVIAINTETPDVYRQIARRLATFDLLVTHDSGKTAADRYGVHGIPHMVIIGRDGRIVAIHRGYQEKALDGIIAEINDALAAR